MKRPKVEGPKKTVSTRVDLPTSIHSKAKAKAALEGKSLKGWFEEVIEKAVR